MRDLSDARAWQEFQARYLPRLLAWCRSKGLQRADAQDVAQEVLLRVARRMPTFLYNPALNFSGWLRSVWHNAWADYVHGREPGTRGTGDPKVHEQLREITGGDLTQELADVFRREALEEALARVQVRVSPRDWQIFRDLALLGRSGTEVGREHRLTLAAVGMVKLRVQRKVDEEFARLEGAGPEGGDP
jgi:RNA polymerase sigma-70 factor (ECF subfamily)